MRHARGAPLSQAEWEAYSAFYQLPLLQRAAAWREVEELKRRWRRIDAEMKENR